MPKVEIEIENYLNESELKEAAREAAKEVFIDGFKKIYPDKRISDYDRIVGNTVHELINQNLKNDFPDFDLSDSIQKAANRILFDTKGLDSAIKYELFKRRSAWDNEEGVGLTLLKESVVSKKDLIAQRVESVIGNIDTKDLIDFVKEMMIEYLDKKIKA